MRFAADGGPFFQWYWPTSADQPLLAAVDFRREPGIRPDEHLESVIHLRRPGNGRWQGRTGRVTIQRECDSDIAGVSTFGVSVRVLLAGIVIVEAVVTSVIDGIAI